MKRRDLLRATGVAAAGAIAGCSTLGIDDGGDRALLMPIREDVVVFTHAILERDDWIGDDRVLLAVNRSLECDDLAEDRGGREFTVSISQGDHSEGHFVYEYPCRPDGPTPAVPLGPGVYRVVVLEHYQGEPNRDVAVYELHVDVDEPRRFTADPGGEST